MFFPVLTSQVVGNPVASETMLRSGDPPHIGQSVMPFLLGVWKADARLTKETRHTKENARIKTRFGFGFCMSSLISRKTLAKSDHHEEHEDFPEDSSCLSCASWL